MTETTPDTHEVLSTLATDATPRSFWILSLALVIFVALLTRFRAEHQEADAWEHHRAVLTLSEKLWPPEAVGNCTQASPEPSIRYSPYSVVLALIVLVSGFDCFDVLSGAAVFNTLGLCLSLWWFLGTYRCRSISTSVLVALIFLYGRPPGYANSTGLSDLPWHQVNPAALSVILALLTWGTFKRAVDSGRFLVASIWISLLSTTSMLTHGMTGILALGELIAAALAVEGRRRWALLGWTLSCIALTFGLSLTWPWYSFLEAVRSNPDPSYWFNLGIYWKMIGIWCLPALIASIAALPFRNEPLVRLCYWALAGAMGVGVLSLLTQSATLMRLPFASIIFAHLLVGRYLHATGVFQIKTWRRRIAGLLAGDGSSLAQVLLVVLMVYCSYWQFKEVASQPFLARPYIAPLLGREDKQPRNLERYREVLAKVGRQEVIVGRPSTAWPAPSFSGRIVGAAHFEFFVPNQFERYYDAEAFFDASENSAQLKILEQYSVRWILLDETHDDYVDKDERLLEPSAVVARRHGLILMDARLWRAAR